MSAEIPHPKFDFTNLGGSTNEWTMSKYHLEFTSEKELMLNGNNYNLIVEWCNKLMPGLHFEEPIPEVIEAIDERILAAIQRLMPEDEYVCMAFSTGIYLKNNQRLMHFLQTCCNYDNDDFVELDKIVGLNTKTFLFLPHSSRAWEVGYPKKD
jgi:hypothetical protein